MTDTTPARRTPSERMYDVALAQASRRSDPVSKVSISDANAKGSRQLTVEVSDPDPKVAAEKSLNLYRVNRAALDKEFPPNENDEPRKRTTVVHVRPKAAK